ncbi:MAG: bifunctional folylpolyglutamate synthase/dihydrofolate synthase, partial [Chitinophagaceae bacterium]|nr:bifunctional folylpolyglutamate synthase/dihydrofolate synthase [Chitinophagaceae bacterium]
MFSRIGAAAYKADLTNTIKLCDALNNPQEKFKTIHVAGTNGKGSVSHMLASILQTAGLKTGLYTSPHLKDFRERIKVNGEMINEKFVIDFTEKINPLIEKIEP